MWFDQERIGKVGLGRERLLARNLRQRSFWAFAMRRRPSSVLGPVLFPPWKRQRRRPGSDFARQAVPFRVFAPQITLNLATRLILLHQVNQIILCFIVIITTSF